MRVALVNNMPDSAFVDTEEQFRRATEHAPGGAEVALELYTITEIPRSEAISPLIRGRYAGLEELWGRPPDALIVTGTEPAQVQLRYEPYWPYLARLLEWAAVVGADDAALVPRRPRLDAPVRRDRTRATRDEVQRGVRRGGRESAGRALERASRRGAGAALARQRRARGRDARRRLPDHHRVRLLGRRVGGSGARARRERVRPLPGPSRVRHAQPAAGVPARRPPLPVRARRRALSADAHRAICPRRPRRRSSAFAAARAAHTRTRANCGRSSPTRQLAPTVENTWAPASATLYANWLRLAGAAVPAAGLTSSMHDETIAIHGGYAPDATRAVAVPIYQTVAHDFIDADHAGAIMDLETPGFHYNRINNPTVDVLERRMAALEGGSGRAGGQLGRGGGEHVGPQRGRRRATTSCRCRSSTARPTPTSRTCCRGSGSSAGSPPTTGRSRSAR